MFEILDKLLVSFGQDALDALYHASMAACASKGKGGGRRRCVFWLCCGFWCAGGGGGCVWGGWIDGCVWCVYEATHPHILLTLAHAKHTHTHTHTHNHSRLLASFLVAGGYVTAHALLLFVHVVTLFVAVNSADQVCIDLMV